MTQPATGALNNIAVLVTRPAQQSQPFIDLLAQAGAQVFACPTIEIQPISHTDSSLSQQLTISDYSTLIFISANAVKYALNWWSPEQISTQTIAAIGQSTGRTLAEHGLKVSLQSQSGFTSEDLLALDEMQQPNITDKRILIIRGEGGREHLAQSLTDRGALVDYAEVYRRTIPDTDIGPILEKWARGAIDLVTVTSNQTLDNLYHLLGAEGSSYLNSTALVVPGQRCYEFARSKGHNNKIQLSSSALDKDMFQAVLEWQRANNR